jgi:hypothetical protein
MENIVGWSREKTLAKAKGCQALVAVDKCVSLTPNIKVHRLEISYELVSV